MTNDAETSIIAGDDDKLKLYTSKLIAEYAYDEQADKSKFKLGQQNTYTGLTDFEIHSKGALLIPSGDLGERPANAANGFALYNR